MLGETSETMMHKMEELMKSEKAITKAAVEDYCPEPFFYIDKVKFDEEEATRFVAYTQDDALLGSLIERLLDILPNRLEVLLKVAKEEISDEVKWDRYYGKVTKDTLAKVVSANFDYLLHDGSHEFCVKVEDSGEYFAIDDHAIVFIYSSKPEYEDALVDLGFEQRQNPLIFDGPHWHVILRESKALQKRLIKTLELKSIGE